MIYLLSVSPSLPSSLPPSLPLCTLPIVPASYSFFPSSSLPPSSPYLLSFEALIYFSRTLDLHTLSASPSLPPSLPPSLSFTFFLFSISLTYSTLTHKAYIYTPSLPPSLPLPQSKSLCIKHGGLELLLQLFLGRVGGEEEVVEAPEGAEEGARGRGRKGEH